MADTEPIRKVRPLQIAKVVIVALNLLLAFAGIAIFSWEVNLRGAWKSFTMSLACTMILVVNYHVMKGNLLEKFSQQKMRKVRRLGIVLTITSTVICVSSLMQGYMLHQDFCLDGYYAAAIPSFLSVVWFAVLAYEASSYLAEIPEPENYAKLDASGMVV